MGKRARLDRRSKQHIKVDDAADVVAGLRLWAGGGGTRGPAGRWAGAAAAAMMARWDTSPVVLRVDGDFAAALIDSHTAVELVPDWIDRFPFNAIAYSLAEPLSLHDGTRMCHYAGMLATGVRAVDTAGTPGLDLSTPAQPTEDRWQLDGAQITHHVGIPGSDGVRCVWVLKEDGDPRPRLQSVSFQLHGDLADQETTLSGLIGSSASMANDFGQSQGRELPHADHPVLVAAALHRRHQTRTRLAAARTHRPTPSHQDHPHRQPRMAHRSGPVPTPSPPPTGDTNETDSTAGTRGVSSPSGRRLPAHIRKAHWHRVRIAERDTNGKVIGTLHGTQGVDWHYELRWYPPTSVNADHGHNPTVRDP